jgi:hypothetical protein
VSINGDEESDEKDQEEGCSEKEVVLSLKQS